MENWQIACIVIAVIIILAAVAHAHARAHQRVMTGYFSNDGLAAVWPPSGRVFVANPSSPAPFIAEYSKGHGMFVPRVWHEYGDKSIVVAPEESGIFDAATAAAREGKVRLYTAQPRIGAGFPFIAHAREPTRLVAVSEAGKAADGTATTEVHVTVADSPANDLWTFHPDPVADTRTLIMEAHNSASSKETLRGGGAAAHGDGKFYELARHNRAIEWPYPTRGWIAHVPLPRVYTLANKRYPALTVKVFMDATPAPIERVPTFVSIPDRATEPVRAYAVPLAELSAFKLLDADAHSITPGGRIAFERPLIAMSGSKVGFSAVNIDADAATWTLRAQK